MTSAGRTYCEIPGEGNMAYLLLNILSLSSDLDTATHRHRHLHTRFNSRLWHNKHDAQNHVIRCTFWFSIGLPRWSQCARCVKQLRAVIKSLFSRNGKLCRQPCGNSLSVNTLLYPIPAELILKQPSHFPSKLFVDPKYVMKVRTFLSIIWPIRRTNSSWWTTTK